MDREKGVRGQSLAEFAIVASLLILIMLGVFDLGRVFYSYVVITNAAREGAYYGGMQPDDHPGIIAHVRMEAQGSGVALEDTDVYYIYPDPPTGSGVPKIVCVQYRFSLLTSFLPGGREIHLKSCAQMVTY